jgi:CBS domain containing-hemolysin-like protein
LYQHFAEGTEEIHEKSQLGMCHIWDLMQATSKHKSQALLLEEVAQCPYQAPTLLLSNSVCSCHVESFPYATL